MFESAEIGRRIGKSACDTRARLEQAFATRTPEVTT